MQSPVLRVAPAERSPSQWEAARHISTTPSPTTPLFPRPPRTSSLCSSLGKSREGREGAQAICGTQKVAQQHQQQDGRSSGPGNWLKGSFLRHILLSAGLAQDGREDKQTIRKVLIRRLSFSHFPTVSDLQTQTRVNSDPSEPSVDLFIKMMRLAWQLGWWTHICTALFTPQRRQLKHRAKRSGRPNAFVVIIDMLSWKNHLLGCRG